MATPKRRCLLCRRPPLDTSTQQKLTKTNKDKTNPKSLENCALTLCSVFGIPETHPFKVIYERAQYCEECLSDLQQHTELLTKLEEIRQSLLKFQNRVYSKLGDNYFQIENRQELKVSPEEFDKGQKAVQGKKFSYDQIVKVIYEKLEKDCLKWDRFSGKEVTVEVSTTSRRVTQVDIGVQTEPEVSGGDQGQINWNGDDDDNFADITGGDDMDMDDFGDTEVTGGDDNGTTSGDIVGVTSISTSASVSTPTPTKSKVEVSTFDLNLPFTQTPINFDNKIFCTADPENCKRFFYDDYNLKVHIRSFHEGNPLPHVCTECEKGFVDENRLRGHYIQRHIKYFSGVQSHMCDYCGKNYSSASVLRKHVLNSHLKKYGKGNGAKGSYKCSFCTCPFEDHDEFTAHESLHRQKEHPFVCVLCDEICNSSQNLKRHYRESHQETKWTCEICGKTLANENTLKRHQVIHTRQFSCDQCTFSGSCENSLKRHQLEIHLNDQAFTCEQCGKTFKNKKNLNSHLRMHTGEMPYKCLVCDKAFVNWAQKHRHEQMHNKVPGYYCNECGRGFKTREDWRKHLRVHRKGPRLPKLRKKPRERKPRTEEQKEKRRQKERERRERLREEQGLSPLPPYIERGSRSPVKKKKSPAKVISNSRTIKTKKCLKGKKRKGEKGQRRSSPRRKVKQEEEEYDGWSMEDEEDVEDQGYLEVKQAVETIEREIGVVGVPQHQQQMMGGNQAVYQNHYQFGPQEYVYMDMPVLTPAPGSGTVGYQGQVERTASQLVLRRGHL